MQLSPIVSPRKLDNPGTINIFGNTSNGNNAPSGSLFTSNNLIKKEYQIKPIIKENND